MGLAVTAPRAGVIVSETPPRTGEDAESSIGEILTRQLDELERHFARIIDTCFGDEAGGIRRLVAPLA